MRRSRTSQQKTFLGRNKEGVAKISPRPLVTDPVLYRLSHLPEWGYPIERNYSGRHSSNAPGK
jgi:hypothetical protein